MWDSGGEGSYVGLGSAGVLSRLPTPQMEMYPGLPNEAYEDDINEKVNFTPSSLHSPPAHLPP